jgi:hypothetical protein
MVAVFPCDGLAGSYSPRFAGLIPEKLEQALSGLQKAGKAKPKVCRFRLRVVGAEFVRFQGVVHNSDGPESRWLHVLAAAQEAGQPSFPFTLGCRARSDASFFGWRRSISWRASTIS